MKKTVVVVNPRSQNGALGRKWPEIARLLGRELGSFEHVMTEGPRDATIKTREALRGGADVVVAIGGDGTIHEVANGFFDGGEVVRPGAALGILPFGTGGDFRKTVRIPSDLAGAAAVLRAGVTRPIDLGRLTYRAGGASGAEASCVFVNIASFGIGGLVDQIVNSSSKWMGGTLSFFLATARAAVRYRNQPVRLILDEKDDEPIFLTINNVAVANGRYFGGGMHIAPEARVDDGSFDVVAIGDLGPVDMVRHGSKLYRGTHLGLDKVFHRRARKVQALPENCTGDILLDVDGEAPGALPATFEILPGILPLVAPLDT